MLMHPSLNSNKAKRQEKSENFSFYSTAMPPIRAAPSTPQAAVCRGTAAPLEVEVVVVAVVEAEPLCA
jgi:hypothetical protein